MKNIVLVTVAMVFALQSLFVPTAVVTLITVITTETAWANSCTNKTLAACKARDPSNYKYTGEKKIALRYSVQVCHPDFDLLARKWFSFAFFPQGKQTQAVEGLRAGKQWREKVELPEGQRCIEHFYEPGRVLMIVSPCRVPGKNVILVTRPLTADDNGTKVKFYEIAGSTF